MKTCPVCALNLEDTYLFCTEDGSSLSSLAVETFGRKAFENESRGFLESDDHTSEAVVLYCPTCAAEYPLTFSECPVHGVQLTKHKIPRLLNRKPNVPTRAEDDSGQVTMQQLKAHEPKVSNQLTSLNLERPLIDGPRRMTVDLKAPSVAEFGESDAKFDDSLHAAESPSNSDNEFNQPELPTHVREQGFERPGFRVAAIATTIALGLFGLVALYIFVSNLSRRPSSPLRVASQAEAVPQPLPFIPTPQEAQDYKEQQPAPVASDTPSGQAERPVEKKRVEKTSSSSTENKSTVAQSFPKPPPVTTPTPSPVRINKVSNPPALDLPRGNSAGFDARLVRVRGRQTSSGYRYDLTFNMQEQAGRSAQWQRLLISTRSASGRSHSESIPFQHRLGATGALTFTISVELAGRSEPDWQGRVVCTTLGWDNKGAPLQASFGTNVKPW